MAMTAVRNPQSFDHLPHLYDRFAVLAGDELHAYLKFRLPRAGGRAADLGCGTGVHTALLAERYNEVLAVDLSGPMLDLAKARRPADNVRYERRDLASVTPETDGTFDLVLSAYTLHHVPDLELAIIELRRLVRPGGQVILVDVVDERRQVPRSWLRREAYRTCRDDIHYRRRPVREAIQLLRLQLDRNWLDHQTTDKLLPPTEWEDTARRVLPGARITEFYRARALHWAEAGEA
jgi:ubiquinone/menaquinone biosynthesis C-methylase UbiE